MTFAWPLGGVGLGLLAGTVNHARLRAVTAEHPFDLSKTL
jgi:hypothetical protein